MVESVRNLYSRPSGVVTFITTRPLEISNFIEHNLTQFLEGVNGLMEGVKECLLLNILQLATHVLAELDAYARIILIAFPYLGDGSLRAEMSARHVVDGNDPSRPGIKRPLDHSMYGFPKIAIDVVSNEAS